jgi:type IV pilus assembly protein PilE
VKHIYQNGFSLFELLITLSIVSILAISGSYWYGTYVTKARRLQAAGTLSELAVAMEAYQIEYGSYENAELAKLNVNMAASKPYYEFKIESATATDYVLTAIAHGNQASNDQDCASLSLNAKGEKYFCH